MIREWATVRGLYEKGDAKTQYVKLQEEAGELAKALLKNDEPEIIDAIGDIVVVLTNLSHLAGYKIEDCIQAAYDVISKRTVVKLQQMVPKIIFYLKMKQLQVTHILVIILFKNLQQLHRLCLVFLVQQIQQQVR